MAFPAFILQTVAALFPTTCITCAAAVMAPADELAAVSGAESLESSADLAKRVDRLIEQLGDPRFPMRERAQAELAELGSTAFDALTAAQSHRDLEIAHRARTLVQSIRMDWVRDTDSEAIRKLLEDYDLQTDQERRKRITVLAGKSQAEGLAALCRLVRFERSVQLSKEAALAVMDQKRPAKADWPERSRIIREETQLSKRSAARWLAAYAQFASRPEEALAAWKGILEEENEQTKRLPTHEQRSIQAGLFRQQVIMLLEAEQQDEALVAMRRMLDIENSDSQSLAELIQWVIRQEAWPLVDEVAQRLDGQLTGNAYLMYLVAQAHDLRGDTEAAEAMAAKALGQAGDIDGHFRLAYQLHQNGLLKWAEREYQAVIAPKGQAADSPFISYTYGLLGELLNDQQRFGEAADKLEEYVKTMAPKPRGRPGRGAGERSRDQVLARMHFFRAKQHAAEKDTAKQIEHLHKALEHDATEADVLIALYRAEQSPEEHKKVLAKIRNAAALFKQRLVTAPEDTMWMNQYAWLVGNTEGDYDEAIRHSQRSLELAEEEQMGGYLDTLAHCYAAKKDYETALKHQARALELEPHSGEIRRAYERFKRLREEQVKNDE
jgi:tetratricopeptide (TPR) repeat protein